MLHAHFVVVQKNRVKPLRCHAGLHAAQQLDVSVVTTLLSYSYGDSTTNLIQPFFAIPILAVTRLRFGDVVGYTFLIALACFLTTTVVMFLILPNL